MFGMKLPEIDDINVPRFCLPVNKINYGSLLAKAFYFYKRDCIKDMKKKRQSRVFETSDIAKLTEGLGLEIGDSI